MRVESVVCLYTLFLAWWEGQPARHPRQGGRAILGSKSLLRSSLRTGKPPIHAFLSVVGWEPGATQAYNINKKKKKKKKKCSGMERYSCVEVEPEELELSLGRRRCSDPPPPCSTGSDPRNLPSSDERVGQITIFYDGQVSVCTITDFQAKAIMEMAKNEMNRSMGANKNGKQEEEKESSLPGGATTVESQLLNPGLSMKRSLQRFLQKRKTRMADLSCPYGKIQKPLQLFSSSS
ncbi:hypothetical protein KFK09_002705 [Dendrobium nobile]|uniref:Protein TIFY n=1 Tax=Dendrobium nobile TaxID=94219 RepID=A0A8T3C237_DENNO|nr:hypothetical protein KFK09_002705 [Dendrobium nobile]